MHNRTLLRAFLALVAVGALVPLAFGSTWGDARASASTGPRDAASASKPGGADVPPIELQSARAQAAATLMASTNGTARINYDAASGAVTSVFAGAVPLSGPSTGTTGEIARNFLKGTAGLFSVNEAFVPTLIETTSYVTGSGLRVVELAQLASGYRVFNSSAKVSIDPQGRVVAVATTLRVGATLASASPKLTEDQAKAAAYDATGQIRPNTAGMDPALAAYVDPPAPLYAFPTANSLRLAYAVQLQSGPDRLFLMVDAATGKLLYRHSLTADAGPEGEVFTNHPAIPCTVLPCGQSAPIAFNSSSAAPYTLADANHNPWVTGTATQGNNVTARDASTSPSATPTGPVVTDAGAAFDYPFQNSYELTGTPSAQDINGSVTNLFYQNNYMHDWMYSLGFTEAARNFQTNNFSLGGSESDAVIAGAMFGRLTCPPGFGSCRNNANFSTPPDGLPGVMRMYLFVPSFPRRDGDLDGDVISHEYGHGVSNRLIGDGTGLDTFQGASMGEAWSDYWAITRYNDPLVGEYVTGDLVKGIRSHSYANHPDTFGKLCTFGGCEVHRDGEIWAAALWDLREKYRAVLGPALGTTTADQVVFDGIATTPIHPSMLAARDAIIASEVASAGGIPYCDLWTVFAAHGFGWSALGANDQGPVYEAFDRAPACGDFGTIGVLAASVSPTISENAGTATVVLERKGSAVGSIAVTVNTVAGTATAADYTPLVGTVVTFPAGSTRAAVNIPITDDAAVEGTEKFSVVLSNPTGGASLAIAAAVVRIVDNDSFGYLGAPIPIEDGLDAEVPGSTALATITVAGQTSNITDLNVYVDVSHTFVGDLVLSLKGPDNTTVTLVSRPGSGNCSGAGIYALFDDAAPVATCSNSTGMTTGPYRPVAALSAFNTKSANGTWTLQATDYYAGDSGTINSFALAFAPVVTPPSPGSLQFTASTASGAEGTSVQPQAQRAGGSAGAVSAWCATTDAGDTAIGGTDFVHIFGQVSWADGDTATKACPSISLMSDGVIDPNETFHVRLINPLVASLGGTTSMTVTILPPQATGNIQISPLTASNLVNSTLTITGHVNLDLGGGLANAPDGTQITFGAIGAAAFVGGVSTCVTAGGTGSCAVQISATNPETTIVSARIVTPVLRQTGDGLPLDSPSAHITWITALTATTSLKTAVLGSGAAGTLPNQLASYLKSAESYLTIGSPTMKAAACQQLKLFKTAVTAAIPIDAQVAIQGPGWIAQADAVRAAIPCLPPN